jgi:hypothetical protein
LGLVQGFQKSAPHASLLEGITGSRAATAWTARTWASTSLRNMLDEADGVIDGIMPHCRRAAEPWAAVMKEIEAIEAGGKLK